MNSHIYDYYNNQLSKTKGKTKTTSSCHGDHVPKPNGGNNKKTTME